MALKTEKIEKSPEPAVKPDTTVLELALYTQYTWQGETYEKGKPYRLYWVYKANSNTVVSGFTAGSGDFSIFSVFNAITSLLDYVRNAGSRTGVGSGFGGFP